MMNKLKVEGNSNLYRDVNSGAIVNSNRDEYENYMKSKLNRDNLFNEINTLRNDLDEIKKLLKQLTHGN